MKLHRKPLKPRFDINQWAVPIGKLLGIALVVFEVFTKYW
jgi:hypothetical protein